MIAPDKTKLCGCKTCLEVLNGLSPKGKQYEQGFHKTIFIDAHVAAKDSIRFAFDEMFKHVNITHEYVTSGGNTRIGINWDLGNYSYVGTDVLSITPNMYTMNIANWNLKYVCQHELGHDLSMFH